MAKKLSELECWLAKMQAEGARDSSGQFTLDAGSRLDRYATLLELNPSLPWLQLTQWAHQQKATSVQLRVTREGVEWKATGLRSQGDWEELLTQQIRPDNSPLLTLHAYKPKGIVVVWDDQKGGWDWNWPGPTKLFIRPPNPACAQELTISLRVSLSALQRANLIEEFTARTHFSPLDLCVDGLPHPSRLDLTSASSRSFGVSSELVNDDGEHFAAVQPSYHQAQMVLVNSHMAVSLKEGSGNYSSDQVACYHLHHPDLSSQTCPYGEETIGISDSGIVGLRTRLGLKQSAAFVGPPRLWVSRSLFGFSLSRETIRPIRTRAVYLLSANPERGPVHIIPVRYGVSLNPITLPGSRSGSTNIVICPPELHTDLSGLRLVEDAACQAWLQQVVDSSRRCL